MKQSRGTRQWRDLGITQATQHRISLIFVSTKGLNTCRRISDKDHIICSQKLLGESVIAFILPGEIGVRVTGGKACV